MNDEEIKREIDHERMIELANETREAPFDIWFGDHRRQLAEEFAEEKDDEFTEFARNKFNEENED